MTPAWISKRRSHWKAMPSWESKALISASPPWRVGHLPVAAVGHDTVHVHEQQPHARRSSQDVLVHAHLWRDPLTKARISCVGQSCPGTEVARHDNWIDILMLDRK